MFSLIALIVSYRRQLAAERALPVPAVAAVEAPVEYKLAA
jgi:hypothetical protein